MPVKQNVYQHYKQFLVSLHNKSSKVKAMRLGYKNVNPETN